MVRCAAAGRAGPRTAVAALVAVVVAVLVVGCSSSNGVIASRQSAPRPASGSTDTPTARDPELDRGLEAPTPGQDVPCPTGELRVEVTSVDAVDQFDTGTWLVELSGTVDNGTDAPVSGVFVEVVVPGSRAVMGFTDDFEIAAGATTTWSATTMVVDGPEPTTADAVIESWMWADFDLFGCPTD